MALKTQDSNWFRPLWRRVLVAAFLTIWLAWEALWTRDQFWAVLVGLVLAYFLYSYFYAFPKEDPSRDQIAPSSAPDSEDGPRP